MIHKLRGGAPVATLILALVAMAAGCGDDAKAPAQPPNVFAPPTNLRAVHGDGEVALSWDGSPDESWGEFRRYNLYRSTTSLVGVDPTQLGTYLVQSVAAGVHAVDTPVTNGTPYFYHIRGERTTGVVTAGTNEVRATGRFEGAGKVIDEFESEGASGFDLSDGLAVSLDQSNAQRFEKTDFYLGTSAESDTSTGELRLKSPHLLGVAGYRTVGIKILGTDWTVATTTDDGWSEQVAVVKDLVYAIRVPATGSPANYAKLQVTAIKSSPAGERNVTFRYAYQSGADLILF